MAAAALLGGGHVALRGGERVALESAGDVALRGGDVEVGVGVGSVLRVTAGGALAGPRALRRDAARTGQTVFVSGRLGDAALGVLRPSAETRAARHAWRPHMAEAAALAQSSGAVACMDISDGLLLDATRLARASGVTLALESARVPVSALFAATLGADRRVALAGGEDYVLLFTADSPPPFEAWAIGRVVEPIAGAPVLLDDAPAPALGWDHFS